MKQLLDKNGNKMIEIAVVPVWKKIVYVAVLYTCPFIIFLKLNLPPFSSPYDYRKNKSTTAFFEDFQKLHLPLMKKRNSNR